MPNVSDRIVQVFWGSNPRIIRAVNQTWLWNLPESLVEDIAKEIADFPAFRPAGERYVGVFLMAVSLVTLVVGLGILPDDLEYLGIEWWRIVTVSIAISALLVVNSYYRDYRQIHAHYERVFRSLRKDIQYIVEQKSTSPGFLREGSTTMKTPPAIAGWVWVGA